MAGRVAVTGASGFIGRAVVARLRTHGWHVRALLRRSGSEPGRDGIEPVPGSLEDRASLERLVDGADAVVTDALQGFAFDRISGRPAAFELQVNGGAGDDFLNAEAVLDPFVLLTLDGGTGDDQLHLPWRMDMSHPESPEAGNRVFGQDGNDIIVGGNADELILGGSGNDHIRGVGGNDTISGGDGSDWIHGGSGDDFMAGAGADDTLLGGTGDDLIHGGSGNDRLDGQRGRDSLAGGTGDDDFTTDDDDLVDEAFAEWFEIHSTLLSSDG